MKKFYSVVRIFYKGKTETHSVQQFTDIAKAQSRYFNILAADLAAEDVTYCSAYIIDSDGMMIEGRVFDKTVTEDTATTTNATTETTAESEV